MRGRPALVAVLLAAAGAGCSGSSTVVVPVPTSDTVSVSFQDGVVPAGYHGTADAIIKDGPNNALRNGNFGAAQSDTLGSVLLSTAFYERRLIIRMDLSSIKSCSKVLSATLSLRITGTPSSPMTIEAHTVTLANYNWTEGVGGLAAGVSWTTIDGSIPWITAGGDFESADVSSAPFYGETTLLLALPPALVKEWILTPASNHGIIIKSTDVSDERYGTVLMRDDPVTAWRPRLDIRYVKGP
ncbi:MAG TPA: DNRLRE domain-containing protein [Candidatus Bathyarchaeia archaeon]|nr:DNRLRE domain-containing protein [Candidatus Bathyarchaeia archaeon]